MAFMSQCCTFGVPLSEAKTTGLPDDSRRLVDARGLSTILTNNDQSRSPKECPPFTGREGFTVSEGFTGREGFTGKVPSDEVLKYEYKCNMSSIVAAQN